MLSIPLIDKAVTNIFIPQFYDDSFDRIHYVITSSIIGFFAIMISAKQYIGNPIQCWTYKEFSTSWEQYAEDYCFIKNTYYYPLNQFLPSNDHFKSEKEINYYQWVPIILSIQAFLFYFPNVIWKYVHKKSDINYSIIIEEAYKLKKLFGKDKNIEKVKLSNCIYDCLEVEKFNKKNYQKKVEKVGGYKLTVLFIVVKFLYIINIVFQLHYMNFFIGKGNILWGLHVLSEVVGKNKDIELNIFPRITFCDFTIKRLGSDHSYTLQCVLMINMFNEKIFLFLWFWFIFILIISIFNIANSFWLFVSEKNRNLQVKRYLKSEKLFKKDKYFITFCREALKSDGILLLNLIENHAGFVITKEITKLMFKRYINEINDMNDLSNKNDDNDEFFVENVEKNLPI